MFLQELFGSRSSILHIYIIIYTVYIILFNGPASGGPPSTPGDGDGPFFCICKLYMFIYTLWLFNIAMGFIDGLPIKNGDFAWLC